MATRSQRSVKPQGQIVLCIDDNQDLLDCEKALLESFGYSVLTAPSGGKGLELAASHSVDLVVVDYFMPEMNGQDVAVEMKHLRPRTPIIMLSGAADIPERALASVDAFVPKDHLASQLLVAIARLQECDGLAGRSNIKEDTRALEGLSNRGGRVDDGPERPRLEISTFDRRQ